MFLTRKNIRKNTHMLIYALMFSLIYITYSHGSALEFSLHEIHKNKKEIKYVFCIDGGGSKTELQVLDTHGNIVQLSKDGLVSDTIKAGCSNFVTVGENGVKNTIQELFKNVQILSEHSQITCELSSIAHRSIIVGGFAGGDQPESQAALKLIFKSYGFNNDNLFIMTDADLVLEGAPSPGIILISGTGSICLGKHNNTIFRVGGLGRYIGDEGSGYKIGISALKAGLEDAYGWGENTSLTQELKSHFNQNDIKNLIIPFYKGLITPDQIAALAPMVFNHAHNGDMLALRICDQAAQDLGFMLKKMVKISNIHTCPIYLVGGVFKNISMDIFIPQILAHAGLTGWHVTNLATEHIATIVIQEKLRKREGLLGVI